ncbi:F-box protein [Cardamine amara subsp. amara]|uniref:F-box protein n=1 Tax=Cardamine amara subsp. amara TaxID=228776 RepID=A0ABD1BQ48_CARAN
MTNISNLPRDLTEEVLSKLPLTSLKRVRSTCKNWNNVSKDRSFAMKHLGDQAKLAAREREFKVVMIMDFKVYLMSVNLDNNGDVESCIKPQAKLISLDDEVDDVYQVFHCNGLLLCITKDNTRLTVWNPYWGHVRLIEPTHNFHRLDWYYHALGYNKSSKSYKILRFTDYDDDDDDTDYFVDFRIYDFNSNSWRVLDITHQDWVIFLSNHGVSLKGNTYWLAKDKYSEIRITAEESVLVCFDFTSETFGQPLSLPFKFYNSILDTMSLSIVREEQLVLLRNPWNTLSMEIWVTTKIEPNTVSWNSKVFLETNIIKLIPSPSHFPFPFTNPSFFIDEEKKVAVVFDKATLSIYGNSTCNNKAYIFGVDGSLEKVDLRGVCAKSFCYTHVCSYVPSLMQLNDRRPPIKYTYFRKRKRGSPTDNTRERSKQIKTIVSPKN